MLTPSGSTVLRLRSLKNLTAPDCICRARCRLRPRALQLRIPRIIPRNAGPRFDIPRTVFGPPGETRVGVATIPPPTSVLERAELSEPFAAFSQPLAKRHPLWDHGLRPPPATVLLMTTPSCQFCGELLAGRRGPGRPWRACPPCTAGYFVTDWLVRYRERRSTHYDRCLVCQRECATSAAFLCSSACRRWRDRFVRKSAHLVPFRAQDPVPRWWAEYLVAHREILSALFGPPLPAPEIFSHRRSLGWALARLRVPDYLPAWWVVLDPSVPLATDLSAVLVDLDPPPLGWLLTPASVATPSTPRFVVSSEPALDPPVAPSLAEPHVFSPPPASPADLQRSPDADPSPETPSDPAQSAAQLRAPPAPAAPASFDVVDPPGRPAPAQLRDPLASASSDVVDPPGVPAPAQLRDPPGVPAAPQLRAPPAPTSSDVVDPPAMPAAAQLRDPPALASSDVVDPPAMPAAAQLRDPPDMSAAVQLRDPPAPASSDVVDAPGVPAAAQLRAPPAPASSDVVDPLGGLAAVRSGAPPGGPVSASRQSQFAPPAVRPPAPPTEASPTETAPDEPLRVPPPSSDVPDLAAQWAAASAGDVAAAFVPAPLPSQFEVEAKEAMRGVPPLPDAPDLAAQWAALPAGDFSAAPAPAPVPKQFDPSLAPRPDPPADATS